MPRRRELITIESFDDLENVAEKVKTEEAQVKHCLRVGQGTGCVSQNSPEVRETFEAHVKERELDDQITVKGVGCNGLCAAGPLVHVSSSNTLYRHVTVEDVPNVLDSLDIISR